MRNIILLLIFAFVQITHAQEMDFNSPNPKAIPPRGDNHDQTLVKSGAHIVQKSTDPEIALGWLKNGNDRYLKRQLRKDGKTAKEAKIFANGQRPHSIILSCSDSRVPPEIVFDQSVGEIFVIRVAGEALDSSVVGSIEYAAEHLGTSLVLVMGHTSCGAVKAAIDTPKGKSAGSPDLDKLIGNLRPHIGNVSKASEGLVKESSANAKGIAKELLQRSPILKAKVDEGHLKIKSAIYHLDSGKVEFF